MFNIASYIENRYHGADTLEKTKLTHDKNSKSPNRVLIAVFSTFSATTGICGTLLLS